MHRVTLGNKVFEGNNNAYLFTGDQTVLIDTGIATDETREQLQNGLAEHDVSFSDIDSVFLTHYHADHSGLAGEIQDASGATVYAHPDDAPLIEGTNAAWDELREQQLAHFDAWEMPQDYQDGLVAHMDGGPDRYGDPVETEPFENGALYDIGETELEILYTPGHTKGLTSFVMTDRDELLSGDALLPVYTPNVGGADVRVDRPLERYLNTLETIAKRDFDRAWPGHRDPIDDPTDRAEFIISHHEERAYRVINVLAERGEADAWTVSADLFGDLERIHVLHGPGEAYAHLEHLERSGEITQNGTKYRLTDETRERFSEINDEHWPLSW